MLQEDENRLKIESEDFSSAYIDSKSNSQCSKYIDTDPYTYVSDLIIQISKSLGKGLSQKGINCLFLFLLTGGLLYAHTVFPNTLIGFLKLYFIPLIFFSFFIIDLLKNVTFVNNWFMKTFRKSDFACYTIINESISLYELENYLQYKAFNHQQLKDIVEYLIKKDQFSPSCQAKLMRNRALYEVESTHYIKESLLKYDFTTQAVCIFLKNMKMRLDSKYLEKLIEKYDNYPSVLFSIGKYHNYRINEINSLYKLGHEFKYKKNPYSAIYFNSVLAAGLFCVLSLFAIANNLLSGQPVDQPTKITVGISFLLGCFFMLIEPLKESHFKKSITKYLLDKKGIDKNITESIIEDLS